jgi:hypothetical protein
MEFYGFGLAPINRSIKEKTLRKSAALGGL